VNRSLKVLAGPARLAHRYAQRMGWAENEYIVITRGHQLARLDPARVKQIVVIKVHALGKVIAADIHEEILRIKALWPVPMVAAA
jgi:hypothetical protein